MQADFSNLTHEPSTFQKPRNFQKEIVVSSIISKNCNFSNFCLSMSKVIWSKIKKEIITLNSVIAFTFLFEQF